ncbi:MAG: hypothetical protein ACI841_000089 [Planctomycetota bacterium]|jgi:hypothetical protein
MLAPVVLQTEHFGMVFSCALRDVYLLAWEGER